MSILITGGAGFIGSRLVKRLRQHDPRRLITVLDNLHPQIHGENPAPFDWGDGVSFLQGDVRDAVAVQRAVIQSDPEIVYHLAAETGTGQSHDLITRYCEVNVTGTARLIEALRAHGRRSHRVILAGSRAIYGEGAYVDEQNGAPARAVTRSDERMRNGDFRVRDAADRILKPIPTTEEQPPQPVSIYASTKLMQELLLEQAAVGATWQPGILRFQNVYGPGQSLRNPYTGVLSIFCSQILAGKTLNIYEDGDIVRDFVYVDDVVEALFIMSAIKKMPHQPINIGTGVPAGIRDVAHLLLGYFNKSTEALRVSGEFRAGDIRFALADRARAQVLLGWAPSVSLADGLGRLAKWTRATSANP